MMQVDYSAAKDRDIQTDRCIDVYHVNSADGIRAIAVGIVLWFHLWQQSWLSAYIPVPTLFQGLGLKSQIDLTFIPRSGYLFVDMLLLLSAFCLFLPHARMALLGEQKPDLRLYARRRIARIVPSYYLCVIVLFFFFALPRGEYQNSSEAIKDLASTLSFLQPIIMNILFRTKLNGALWTAAVEMQFYLIFPFLAYCFRKHPGVTYLLMVSASMAYLFLFAIYDPDRIRMTLNQLPAFLGVFANGMLAAYAYVYISNIRKHTRLITFLSTGFAFTALVWILSFCKAASYSNNVQIWQAKNRLGLSTAFTLFLLSTSLSAGWLRFLLGNKFMRFLAGISYNVYIWHQWLAVRLKEWHIPYWEGEVLPNMQPDVQWQHKYSVVVIAAAVSLGIVLTYLFERPVYNAIVNLKKTKPPE